MVTDPSKEPNQKRKESTPERQPEETTTETKEEPSTTPEVQEEKEKKKRTKQKKEKVQQKKEGIKKKKRKKKEAKKSVRQKDELTQEIEGILEEGLEDAYKELTPVQKQEFKMKGEETARKIKELIQAGKAKVKKIFELVLEWLKTLPGVNKYFLEQEAKIKADKISKLEQKEEQPDQQQGITIKEE